MIVTRNNPYNNYYLKKMPIREKIVTSKQACEEYQKIMKQKTKTYTFTK